MKRDRVWLVHTFEVGSTRDSKHSADVPLDRGVERWRRWSCGNEEEIRSSPCLKSFLTWRGVLKTNIEHVYCVTQGMITIIIMIMMIIMIIMIMIMLIMIIIRRMERQPPCKTTYRKSVRDIMSVCLKIEAKFDWNQKSFIFRNIPYCIPETDQRYAILE